jgi:hypothetical protein
VRCAYDSGSNKIPKKVIFFIMKTQIFIVALTVATLFPFKNLSINNDYLTPDDHGTAQ